MQSIREQLLQSLHTALNLALSTDAVPVVRSPTVGVDRASAPALLLIPESDAISERANDRVERQLIVRLIALARDSEAESGFAIADRVLVCAHRAVLTAPLDCLGVRELDTDFDTDDSDANAVALPARYEFTYRTLAADLAVRG